MECVSNNESIVDDKGETKEKRKIYRTISHKSTIQLMLVMNDSLRAPSLILSGFCRETSSEILSLLRGGLSCLACVRESHLTANVKGDTHFDAGHRFFGLHHSRRLGGLPFANELRRAQVPCPEQNAFDQHCWFPTPVFTIFERIKKGMRD